MYRCIIASIIESETAYLECLNVMLQVCDLHHKSLIWWKGKINIKICFIRTSWSLTHNLLKAFMRIYLSHDLLSCDSKIFCNVGILQHCYAVSQPRRPQL